MNNIFLVFGYGIPKNILEDENYNFYLKMVFNKIYDFTSKNKSVKPFIVFCGGKTDTFKPYKRTEAEEMIRLFTAIIKQKPFLSQITKKWIFVPEKESLSTLENLVNSKKIVWKRSTRKANLFIFCEQTRGKRVKIIADKIFGKSYNPQVLPIDFDMSPNRYLSLKFLAEKEKTELDLSLRALKNPDDLKKQHRIFKEKFEYFRKLGPKRSNEAVREWWKEKLKELKK